MLDNITRSSAFDSKQPAITTQTLKDVSNKYESVFFTPFSPVNFHINRGEFLLETRGSPWGGPWTGSMGGFMVGATGVKIKVAGDPKIDDSLV